MSNPAPTLNQINAFNATQGTTIDFNIIGGTEVIRSNKIYIYDLSDNSLICTHLYVSTESIHELPPNTSSSIVYASGKSSADFTNNTQYYAQIQTFTDVGGTQGGSGLSIAKLFWCLPTPTLTLSTIPTTISTTSYNVSATYTPNTSGSATNEIQEFQFNLYSAIGALLQTSGVVLYGDGVDLSYNFSGLEVDSTYYVTLDVTTTQGMNVSAQSNTFTVSIDTPTMGSASVVNNGCDGYISVTSNLSSEYGGSGSGEIVSFETDSENVFTKLQVDLDPVQDLHGYDSPWVGGGGKNKLSIENNYIEYRGIKFAQNADGSITADGTATSDIIYAIKPISEYQSSTTLLSDIFDIQADTSYILSGCPSGGSASTYRLQLLVTGSGAEPLDTGSGSSSFSFTAEQIATKQYRLCIRVSNGTTLNKAVFKPMIRLASVADSTFAPYSNICPITGWTGCEVDVAGVNILDEQTLVSLCSAVKQSDGTYYISNLNSAYGKIIWNNPTGYEGQFAITFIRKQASSGIGLRWKVYYTDGTNESIGNVDQNADIFTTYTLVTNVSKVVDYIVGDYGGNKAAYCNIQIEVGSTATPYTPYNGTTYPVSWQTEAGTVYGGTVDVVTGVLTVDRVIITFNGSEEGWFTGSAEGGTTFVSPILPSVGLNDTPHKQLYNMAEWVQYANQNGMLLNPSTNRIYVGSALTASAFNSDLATFKTYLGNNPLQVCYYLAIPQTYQLTPHQIQTLVGQNNIWSDARSVSVTYNIPITNLLVKRQDTADISGKWLTLYSQPITQASDMDFTFIDFLNQYGKTYKYALVPLLTQQQGDVDVEIEGGYTVSDNVDSIFDGVYIADQTNVERVKAGVGYGNIDMNQGVGSITPIGSKYPIVITNSQNQYHNGSVRGTIVPNDFYSNGNLSRIDMVNKRDELEQFLTNKRAKIIKDWNGNIWLVMIMSNVACSFDDNYGMGMVSFSADWLEVGDPTNQQDLYNAGLINVGGV